MKKRIFLVLTFLTAFVLLLCACSLTGEPPAETEGDYKIKIRLVYPSE